MAPGGNFDGLPQRRDLEYARRLGTRGLAGNSTDTGKAGTSMNIDTTSSTIIPRTRVGYAPLSNSSGQRKCMSTLSFVATLFFLFAAMMNPQSLRAQTLSFTFGSRGTGNGQFNQPHGVALDRSGNIYVVDVRNDRIQKFDSNGAFIFQFSIVNLVNAPVNVAQGVAVDGSGNIYVTDFVQQFVQKFDSNGAFILRFGTLGTGDGQFMGPDGVAVDGSGNVYVSDSITNRIQKFDSNGAFIFGFGSAGSGRGRFNQPVALTVDGSGNIYVADRSNNLIQKFDSTGAFLFQFGDVPLQDGRFIGPVGVAVDGSGSIYVADILDMSIRKFDSNGEPILKFGTFGSARGQFNEPQGIAVDSSGNIHVSDRFNYRIQVFRADTDRDGSTGALDLDSDNDGIPDSLESRLGREVLDDPDGDGIPNELDLDSDGDGIPDVIEAGGQDEDGNGVIDDFRDENRDGLADRLLAAPLPVPDTDQDGIPDFLDGDSDNDGASDVREAGGVDDDGDGMLDDSTDDDADGLADSVEVSPLPLLDADGDGVPDFLEGTGSTGSGDDDGCSVAPVRSSVSAPVYLAIPVIILMMGRRRAGRRCRECSPPSFPIRARQTSRASRSSHPPRFNTGE